MKLQEYLEDEYLAYLLICKKYMVRPHGFDGTYSIDWLFHKWQIEEVEAKGGDVIVLRDK